jgi:hypothetical protein
VRVGQHTQCTSAQHGSHFGPSHTSGHDHQVRVQSPAVGRERWIPGLSGSHDNRTSAALVAAHVLEPEIQHLNNIC